MKKIHILALALAIGLISSNLLMPIAYAEGVVDSAEVTEVEEETTEEVEESEEEVVEEDDEEVEEEAEEAEGEERGEARDDGAMSDIERKPINLPRCEALFAELDGMTLKYGSSTYEYTVVDYMVDKYVLSDYTCRGEIADAYGSDVYVSSHDGYVLMHGESKFNDEGQYIGATIYESAPINFTFEKNESEENATAANEFRWDLSEKISTFMIEGDEIVKFNTKGYDNFDPNELKDVREFMAEHPAITLEAGPIKAVQTCRYDYFDYDNDGEVEDTFEVYYRVPYYIDGYFYGYVGMYIAYESVEMESENEEPVWAQVADGDAEKFVDDTVFVAEKVEVVAADGSTTPVDVVLEGEKLVIVYDLSLKSESEDVKYTQFDYGVVVEMLVEQSLIDMSMPVYARFVDANGNTPDADVPVVVDCNSGYGPLSISDSVAYCRLSFVAPHFSQYAMVQTFTPLVLLENKEPEDGVKAPETGAAPADQSAATASAVPVMAMVVLAVLGLFARKAGERN